MVIDKGYSKAVNTVFQRWLETPVPIDLEGTRLAIHPEYFSILLRWVRFEETDFINDKRKKKNNSVDLDSGFRLIAALGRDPKGSSLVSGIGDDLPDNPQMLADQIDGMMDPLLKHGAVGYLNGAAERIFTTRPTALMPSFYPETAQYNSIALPESLDPSFLEEEIRWAYNELKRLKGMRKTSFNLEIKQEETLFFDTLGSNISQARELLTLIYVLQGKDSKNKEFDLSHALYFAGRELYKRKALERSIQHAISEFEEGKNAIRVPSGSYPILFDGSAAGTFFHESLAAHLLSGKYVALDDSLVFGVDRLGKQVLPEFLTIIDDPTLPEHIGSYHYDDEGVRAQRVILVENGILKNYLLDLGSAALLTNKTHRKFESNGHSRSEWISHINDEGEDEITHPEPRVTNLIIESSNLLDKEALHEAFLRQIRDSGSEFGIMISGNSSGYVMVDDGNFNVKPSKSWAVFPDGKRKMIRDLILGGRPDEFIRSIVATGEPYRPGFGLCGAGSGMVPTQERAPSFLISRLSCLTEAEDTSTPRLRERQRYLE